MNMSTTELHYFLDLYISKNYYTNVVASDMLKSSCTSSKFCIIVNNEPSSMAGGHWIAFFKNGVSSYLEFFDSFARPLESYGKHFIKFVNSFKGVTIYNSLQLQENNTLCCGAFCLYYLIHRCKGYSFESIIKRFTFNDLSLNNHTALSYVSNLVECLDTCGHECIVYKESQLLNQLCKPCSCISHNCNKD